MSRLIGYCRQSTQRQFEENNALERYIDNLKRYGVNSEDIYYDVESGGNRNRKGLNIVLELIRSGEFDTLVVPSLDRLMRDVGYWASISKEFVEKGISIISLDSGKLDIENPNTKLNTDLLMAVNEHTRQINRYNSLQGHKYRRLQHKPARPCFGYKIEDDRLIINRDLYKDSGLTYQEVCNEIFDKFLELGKAEPTVEYLCKKYGYIRLKEFYLDFPRSHRGLIDWLKNPTLIGTLVYFPKQKKRLEFPNEHEPLIDKNLWRTIQNIIEKNATHKKTYRDTNPLTGLIFCGKCGNKMRPFHCGNYKSKYKKYVFCTGSHPAVGKLKTCNVTTSYALQIHDYINATVEKLTEKADEVVKWGLQGLDNKEVENPEITKLRKNIEELKMLNNSYLDEAIQRMQSDLNTLVEKEYELEGQNKENVAKLIEVAQNPNFFANLDKSELSILFNCLVNKIICTEGNIEVFLNV